MRVKTTLKKYFGEILWDEFIKWRGEENPPLHKSKNGRPAYTDEEVKRFLEGREKRMKK